MYLHCNIFIIIIIIIINLYLQTLGPFRRQRQYMQQYINQKTYTKTHPKNLYYKPVVFEVFEAENVQQTNRKSEVFGVIRRWFENGTVDFRHNPHKQSSIDGLHRDRR